MRTKSTKKQNTVVTQQAEGPGGLKQEAGSSVNKKKNIKNQHNNI